MMTEEEYRDIAFDKASSPFVQKYQREAAEADAYLAQRAERRAPEPEKQKRGFVRTPEPKAGMTDQDRQWVEQLIQQRLEGLAAILGDEVGQTQTSVVKKLREEIGQLRAEVQLLRALKANKDVLPMRGRSVA